MIESKYVPWNEHAMLMKDHVDHVTETSLRIFGTEFDHNWADAVRSVVLPASTLQTEPTPNFYELC